MKKAVAILCLVTMMLTVPVLAESRFPDLPEGHWAYSAVDKMVNDGRVNGFPDGTFQPDFMVTRWQFAKMAGGNPDLMSNPDTDATRDDAALYLWERAGKPSGLAPAIITKDSLNPEAVAWAYSTGIMQGDDGVSLRLQSGLTRAEAACLIVRAETELNANVGFKDTVNPVILERVWNSMQTATPWNPEGTVTNGELAYMAMVIRDGSEHPEYLDLKKLPEFEGPYAKALQQVCEECWGEENANEAFMNQPVTIQNMVAALSLYTMKQGTMGIQIDPAMLYEDASITTSQGKLALMFASTNGIYLTAEKKLDANRTASMKDIAAILIQLDDVIGLNRTYGEQGHSKLQKSAFIWPKNGSDYAMILEEVPVGVYEVPLLDTQKPVDSYQYARNFAPALEDFLDNLNGLLPEDVKASWTFYPSMMVKDGYVGILRVKLEIKSNPSNLTLNQILSQNTFTETYTGSQFFVDIATGEVMGDIYLSADNYTALRAFAGKE